MRKKTCYILAVVISFVFFYPGGPGVAQSLNPQMQSLVNKYLAEAQKQDSGIKGFSAGEGKKLYNFTRMHSVKKEERSCSTCHTSNPANQGKTTVGKMIEPLSPAANKARFTDPQKVEKWFKRNCTWVLERECTPKEKGDFVTYMILL